MAPEDLTCESCKGASLRLSRITGCIAEEPLCAQEAAYAWARCLARKPRGLAAVTAGRAAIAQTAQVLLLVAKAATCKRCVLEALTACVSLQGSRALGLISARRRVETHSASRVESEHVLQGRIWI